MLLLLVDCYVSCDRGEPTDGREAYLCDIDSKVDDDVVRTRHRLHRAPPSGSVLMDGGRRCCSRQPNIEPTALILYTMSSPSPPSMTVDIDGGGND